ncbi:MAG: hypothetical protein HQL27_05470 [Candidatus Omnitrophica bacterium]|nr:hypothetical protein [Candidatus Omnitrophota bacterium]
MNKMLKLLAFFCLLCFSVPASGEQQNSQCNDQKWYEDFFNKHTLELVLCQDKKKVCFISDASFGKDLGDTWQSQFSLEIGEQFRQALDDHGSTTFELQAIQEDEVVVKYESTFDHRSFGKNFVTVDTCSIKIPYIARG